MNGESKNSIDRWNKTWRDHLNVGGNVPYFAPLIPKLGQLLHHRSRGKLLDLGCGLGNKSFIFGKLGFDVTAIDGDPWRIESAKKSYPGIDFLLFKVENQLPFEDETFDIVFSSSVFQYWEHSPILKECRRVLKKGGSLVMIENLKNNPITRSGRSFLKLRRHSYHSYPWNHFTYKEITELKKEFGRTSVDVFHLVSPIAKMRLFRWSYPLLFWLDDKLLTIRLFRKWAWLVLFTGVKE